jgi:hypothetical protein
VLSIPQRLQLKKTTWKLFKVVIKLKLNTVKPFWRLEQDCLLSDTAVGCHVNTATVIDRVGQKSCRKKSDKHCKASHNLSLL